MQKLREEDQKFLSVFLSSYYREESSPEPLISNSSDISLSRFGLNLAAGEFGKVTPPQKKLRVLEKTRDGCWVGNQWNLAPNLFLKMVK